MKTFLKENFFKFMIGLSALILSIAVLMYIISITKSPSSLNERVTGAPIRIGRLEVAQYDFPEYMTWSQAVKSCKALESGWRLPTKSELNLLYKNKDKIGGFGPEVYWSRSDKDEENAWGQSFDGGSSDYYKGNLSPVRAVRSY
jgi:hypothetical protein